MRTQTLTGAHLLPTEAGGGHRNTEKRKRLRKAGLTGVGTQTLTETYGKKLPRRQVLLTL